MATFMAHPQCTQLYHLQECTNSLLKVCAGPWKIDYTFSAPVVILRGWTIICSITGWG